MYNFNWCKIFAFTTALITAIVNSNFAIAENIENKSSSEYLISLEFPSSPDRKPPESSAGGGRRGGCVTGKNPLTVLMPNLNNEMKTVSSQPNFWVYVPQTTAKIAQMMIIDETGKDIDIQEIPLKNVPGIIKITLSPDKKLEIGQKYEWQFSLMCTPAVINKNNYQVGTVERVKLTPEIESKLINTPDALGKAKIYANQFIWPETVNYTLSVRNSAPKEWTELLKSVGLEYLSDAPFLN